MKFEQYGEYKENLKIKLKLHEFFIHNLLKDLHNTIDYIKQTKPDILGEFLKKLTKKMEYLTENGYEVNDKTKFSNFIRTYENLVEYQGLTKLSFNFFLQRLGIKEEQIWKKESEEFPPKKMHGSANGFCYNQLTTLIEILGRDEAISFYKEIILNFVHTYDTNQINNYESLEDLREKSIRFLNKGTLGRVRLVSEVKDGRLIKICKNCEKVEFLDDSIRQDGELTYVFCCDVHIPLAEMWN